MLDETKNNYIANIYAIGRTYALSFADISTGEFFVGNTNDVLDDLTRINPAEVIFPFGNAEEKNIKNCYCFFATLKSSVCSDSCI